MGFDFVFDRLLLRSGVRRLGWKKKSRSPEPHHNAALHTPLLKMLPRATRSTHTEEMHHKHQQIPQTHTRFRLHGPAPGGTMIGQHRKGAGHTPSCATQKGQHVWATQQGHQGGALHPPSRAPHSHPPEVSQSLLLLLSTLQQTSPPSSSQLLVS